AFLIGRDYIAEVLWVHASRQRRRTYKVGEHHRDLAALGPVFRSSARGAWSGLQVTGRRLRALVAAQSSDGIEELHAVAQCRDAKLLQVLVRQARQDRLVYLILAECRLILSEAQAP